jgi:uncharacterized protein YbcI
MTGFSPLDGAALTSAISAEMAKLYREFYGYDRTTANTFINDDVVVCVLKDIATSTESRTPRHGDGRAVTDGPVTCQTETENRFTAVVEEYTGRRVMAFLSSNHTTPGCACELFFLDPYAGDGSPPESW